MPFQFSQDEQNKLQTSWLAWKDLKSRAFMEAFKPLWNKTIEEVESLFTESNCRCRVKEVGKIGLSLQRNISFSFSAIPEAYFLNVWSLFFCFMENEKSIFFRPPFLLANEMLHEYSHYKFWKDRNMLGADRTQKEQFAEKYGLDDEKYALSEEANFLRKMRCAVPPRWRIKLFRVQSWTNIGTPICEGRLAQLETRKSINQMINQIERAMQGLSSKKFYDNSMAIQKMNANTALSSVLKLNLSDETLPVVELARSL